MSYGIDLRENLRRAATYVDKILKGASLGSSNIKSMEGRRMQTDNPERPADGKHLDLNSVPWCARMPYAPPPLDRCVRSDLRRKMVVV
jgi:hypothetical protein